MRCRCCWVLLGRRMSASPRSGRGLRSMRFGAVVQFFSQMPSKTPYFQCACFCGRCGTEGGGGRQVAGGWDGECRGSGARIGDSGERCLVYPMTGDRLLGVGSLPRTPSGMQSQLCTQNLLPVLFLWAKKARPWEIQATKPKERKNACSSLGSP